MLLSEMRVGQASRVKGFSEAGLAHQARYLSMGLLPGADVTLRHVAPAGCPLQVKVGSTLISIRRAEAAEIDVEARS